MAMKMSVKEQATEIDQFMNGPLLTWFLTCMELIGEQASEGLSYGTLIDGVLIHRIFRTMQLPVIDDGVCQPLNQKQRYLNLKKIMENIRHFYEVEQNQALMRVPKIDRLAKEPEQNVREMESLLYLLLGCAVSSPNKKAFINAIELLDYESKRDIAMCIMKVLETSEYILSYEKLTSDENQKGNALWALDCIREMQAELDSYREIDYTNNALAAGAPLHTSTARPEAYKSPESERSQLTDNERALRRQINELRDQLYDNVTEVQDLQAKNQQLKKENEALAADAKLALIYRDQLDELQEKAERVERLEIEMQSYKRKMDEFASMKQRLTVLAEENEALLEKQAESEKLYGTYKSRAESYRAELESRIAELEESKHELDAENRSISCENRELRQENAKLEHKSRNSLSSSRVEQSLMSVDSLYETSALNASLSDELAESAKTTLQKIIAEGQRLERTMESLQQQQQQQQGSAAAAKEDYEKERQELSNILWLMRQHAESLTGVNCESGSEVLSDLQRLTRANDRLTAENERLRAELDSARATLANHSNHMKSMDGRDWEVQDLKESIIMLRENYCQLYEENKKLKMRLEAEAKSARENEKRLQLEIFAKDRKVVEVGYQLDMMVDRCAGQAQTISSLSLDKKMLVETNGLLQEQSQEFYMRWMAELQQSRIRESKVHSLCRTKERLEDKIMELHKRNDSPRPPAEKPRKKRSLLTLIRRGGSELFGRGRNGGIEPAASLVRDDFEFSRPAISAAGPVPSSSAFPSSSSHSPTTSSDSDNEPPSNVSSLARNNNNNVNDNNNNDNDEDNERVIDNLVNNVFPAANFARSDTDTQASDTVGKYFGRRNRPFWSSEETRDEEEEEEENAQRVPVTVQLERTTDSEAAEDEEAYFIDARRPVGEETETNLGCA